jgi:tetratricopeptide (TPR) repeat protein
MKLVPTLLTTLLGMVLAAPQSDARGDGGGRAKAPAAKSGAASAKRSPMTNSKIERPTPKPAARPAAMPTARPATKPAARPQLKPSTRPAERPSVQKPSARPETLPGGNNRPGLTRPGGDDKPGISRPGTLPGSNNKPGLTRPGGDDKPGISRPDPLPGNNNKPGLTRPGGTDNPGISRPDTLPGNNNNTGLNRPDQRPSLERPGNNRPSTLPGMVTYPNRPDKGKPDLPNLGGNDRPNLGGNDRDKVNIGDRNRVKIDNSRDRNNVHIENVNVGGRNTGLNRPATLPAGRRDWHDKNWGGKNSVWGNNVNIGNNVNVNIDNNFRRSSNFAYRPNAWGASPWWGAGQCHSWHHGHWGYGYNSRYYRSHWYFHDDDDFASGFMWGIAVWSLGNMIYDMGYNSYRNPYPAPPVQYSAPSAPEGGSKSTISYNQPVSVTAAANPPGDEQAAQLAETKSAEALERSRVAFKQADFVTAMSAVDEAIGHTPGDVTLHEYRALVLFALGKYADATGVLNPVLASGPGWGWDTMVGFYDSSSTYDGQLRKLEAYVQGTPDGAEGHFLLGYHYMVCGHTEKSYEQFDKTATLQPADSIARQLRDLTKSSLPDGGETNPEPPARPAPVPNEKLVGTWVCDRATDGKITFIMTPAGDYTWSYLNAGQSSELKGTYGLNDKGLLVLTTDDSQMVSELTLKDDKQLKFVLIGAPDGDPGLEFTKN